MPVTNERFRFGRIRTPSVTMREMARAQLAEFVCCFLYNIGSGGLLCAEPAPVKLALPLQRLDR